MPEVDGSGQVHGGSEGPGAVAAGVDASRTLAAAGAAGARYKAMSPARLPISRQAGITIPPGISPTALLESPVLLTNIKAEPSPTTGAFSIPFATSGLNASYSSWEALNRSVYDTRNFREFDHINQIRSSNRSLSSLGNVPTSGSTLEECTPSVLNQSQKASTTSMRPVKLEETSQSPELTLAVAALDSNSHAVTLNDDLPIEPPCTDSVERKESETGTVALQPEHTGSTTLTAFEKSVEDGYNWRKYGQKLVKGSEFPRSYYKCTHPNCQMKKQLERSHDGHIAEIIYKGRHDHPKPQPSRRLAVNVIVSGQIDEKTDLSPSSDIAEVLAGKVSCAHASKPCFNDSNVGSYLSPVSASDDDVDFGAGRSRCIGDAFTAEDDDPESKRRRKDIISVETVPIIKPNREPRVVVQTVSEVDILDDGYRWRKYGQKVVKGNPNPRSYYKCTSVGCPVRKHVERASHDPEAVITTYEGKHNHDVPVAKTTSHDTRIPLPIIDTYQSLNDHHISLPEFSHRYPLHEDCDIISLDLGVGLSPRCQNTAGERQQREEVEAIRVQLGPPGHIKSPNAAPMSFLYGNRSTDYYYGPGDEFSFMSASINNSASRPYGTTNSRNLVSGP